MSSLSSARAGGYPECHPKPPSPEGWPTTKGAAPWAPRGHGMPSGAAVPKSAHPDQPRRLCGARAPMLRRPSHTRPVEATQKTQMPRASEAPTGRGSAARAYVPVGTNPLASCRGSATRRPPPLRSSRLIGASAPGTRSRKPLRCPPRTRSGSATLTCQRSAAVARRAAGTGKRLSA